MSTGRKKTRKAKWTNDELAEVASRYDTLAEFVKKESSVYSIIKRRGLYGELCAHMERHHNGKTKEELAAIAAKYDVFAEFREKEPHIFNSIYQRGYLDELCAHMKRGHRKSFSDEELAEIAQKYETHEDFNKYDHSALITIRVRGLYDKLCGHLKYIHHRPRSEEELAEIAARYDSIKEFAEKESSVYGAIAKRGLLSKLCGHMKRSGSLYRRKIYAFTFSDGYAYIGLTHDTERRYREHMTGKGHSPILRHIQETGATCDFVVLTDWLDRDSAANTEDAYIRQYIADGWKMLNRVSGGALGNMASVYTDERIRRETSKYEYIEDFRIQSTAYYGYLQQRGLLGKYCAHMKRRSRNHKKWTIESALEAARTCKSRSELRIKYYQASVVLREAGLLDKYLPAKTAAPSTPSE